MLCGMEFTGRLGDHGEQVTVRVVGFGLGSRAADFTLHALLPCRPALQAGTKCARIVMAHKACRPVVDAACYACWAI